MDGMELSIKKKLAGFAAAGALALAMAPAAAMGVGALTPDTSIKVGGLDQGDSATYYQIIAQDLTTTNPEHIGTQDWKLTAAVDSNNDGMVDGTENKAFGHKNAQNEVVNGLYVDELIIKNVSDQGTKVINADMANAIAAAVANNSAAGTSMGTASASGELSANIAGDKLGLYMVIAEPGENNVDTIYKPIFVSADYDQGKTEGEGQYPNTNSLTVVANDNDNNPAGTDYNGDPGVFKRSKLGVDKKSGARDENGALTGTPKDSQHDVAVGDIVDFTITTNVPNYSKNYTSPVFKITDVLTDGIELCDANGDILEAGNDTSNITVTVKNGSSTITATRWTSNDANADYKVTVNSAKEFVVEFMNDKNLGTDANNDDNKTNDKDGFLYTQTGNPTVVITYKAKVTSSAAEQVNQMDNTVTLKFSNKPTDITGAGELEDKTRHYSFDLDANVLGSGESSNPEKTSELRKIGIDADGKVIEECKTSELESKKESNPFEWLQDAEFELTQTQRYVNGDPATTGSMDDCADVVVKFDENGVRVSEGGSNPKSDANGFITMKGLDAGVYQLKEIAAPVGWTFDPSKVFTITITPSYVLDADENEILSSYTVDIAFKDEKGQDQVSSTTYTANTDTTTGKPISFLDENGEPNKDAGMGVTINSEAETALIVNKKLGILPATGGSGILFYVFIGAAIMALAVFLSRRNRKAAGVAGATA